MVKADNVFPAEFHGKLEFSLAPLPYHSIAILPSFKIIKALVCFSSIKLKSCSKLEVFHPKLSIGMVS